MLYVFGKWPVNVQSCMEQFQQMFPDPGVKVLVFCDVMYSHCMGEKLIEMSFFFFTLAVYLHKIVMSD